MRPLFAAAAVVAVTVAVSAVALQPHGSFRLEEATIRDIHAAFDKGLTCQQLAKLYLDRIAAYDDSGPRLNSVTTINPHALSDAAALDGDAQRHGRHSPLYCIPVLLKDNIDTADMPTSNGSVILRDAVPPDDAPIVKALREAGALILGKASMAEFAGGNGYNTVDGPITNPYSFKRQTGGSSSGSAAAVAANLTVVAVGTDTSTSVRGPSSFNGIVGLRPTTGLISRDGIAPKNLNFDTAGPMGRTVADVATLLTVIAGPDSNDPLSLDVYRQYPARLKVSGTRNRYADFARFLKTGSLRGARLGVLRDFFGGDAEIDRLATAALNKMQALGATLVDVQLPPEFLDFYVRNGNKNIRLIADYRFRADWERYVMRFRTSSPKTVREFIDTYETTVARSALPVEATVLDLLHRSVATSADDPQYKALITNLLPAATRAKLEVFEKFRVDALVFPYQPTFAPPINTPVRRVDDPTFVAAPDRPDPALLAGYSSVGFPDIVVPMGFGSQGLPSDISLMGRPFDEGRIIGYAYDYEQATKWRRPSPLVPPLGGETVQPSPRTKSYH
jgi:amidase